MLIFRNDKVDHCVPELTATDLFVTIENVFFYYKNVYLTEISKKKKAQ